MNKREVKREAYCVAAADLEGDLQSGGWHDEKKTDAEYDAFIVAMREVIATLRRLGGENP